MEKAFRSILKSRKGIIDLYNKIDSINNVGQGFIPCPKVFPHRKRIRLKDFDYATPVPYFITICSKNRAPVFTNEKLSKLVIDCLLEEKKKAGYKIFAYCLMHDHLHLLLAPHEKAISVSGFIGAFKSKSTRIAWEFGISGKLWQARFHDHIVREKDNIMAIGQYILNNPVKKGYVSMWQDYKYLGIVDSWI